MQLAIDSAVAFAASVLVASGAEEPQARRVAAALVEADQAGHEGHGLSRLPGYARRLKQGGTTAVAWREVTAGGPVEHYDGMAGLGHIHLDDAVDRAMQLCRLHGVGVIGVSNSNHAGSLGLRAGRVASAGLVAIIVTNAPAVVAPPGGTTPVLGTNPLAVGAPVADGPPLVCDLSSSQVSRGQIMLAARAGRPIPSEWALDASGQPTTDAAAALVGSLLPLGGPKGFALALAVETLTGLLLGPATGPEIDDFFSDDLSQPQGIAHLVVVLDPTRFGQADDLPGRAARLRHAIQGSGPEGATRMPGARLASVAAQRRDAIPVSDALARALAQLAGEFGLEAPAFERR